MSGCERIPAPRCSRERRPGPRRTSGNEELDVPGDQRGEGGVHHDAYAVSDAAFVDVEVGLVQVERDLRTRRAGTEPDHRAGHLLEVEREVLAAHTDLGFD